MCGKQLCLEQGVVSQKYPGIREQYGMKTHTLLRNVRKIVGEHVEVDAVARLDVAQAPRKAVPLAAVDVELEVLEEVFGERAYEIALHGT